jgi:FMN-dependent NADH-azoreductase
MLNIALTAFMSQTHTITKKRIAMPTLMAIEMSPRFDHSVSRKLTSKFIEDWKTVHPDGKVIVRDLMKTELPWVDLPWIGGAFTPVEQHSEEMKTIVLAGGTLAVDKGQKSLDDFIAPIESGFGQHESLVNV